MARKKSYGGLGELSGMTDEQALEALLGNAQKLSMFCANAPSMDELRRLMALELVFNGAARPHILEKLRSSISRARSRESRVAFATVVAALDAGKVPDGGSLEHLFGYDSGEDGEDLAVIDGLIREIASKVLV